MIINLCESCAFGEIEDVEEKRWNYLKEGYEFWIRINTYCKYRHQNMRLLKYRCKYYVMRPDEVHKMGKKKVKQVRL